MLSLYIYSIVFIFKRSAIIVLQIRLCASYTSAFETESPKCQVATITLSCDVCGLLLNLLCKLNIKIINISVCRIKLRLKSKPINCAIAPEDSQYPARIFLLKGASRVVTIMHAYIPPLQ